MSQTSTDAQIVAEFQDIVTSANIIYSMTALVAYEYIITLRQEMTMYVVFAVFSALRVFALWNRNIPMTLLVLALNLVPAAVDIFESSQATAVFTADPIFGTFCDDVTDASVRVNFDLGDALVLAVTWAKTAKNLAEGAGIGMRTPLSTMLLRDGTVYFAILLMMNIAQVVLNAVPSLENFNFVDTVIQTLQPILISRFLLNLRQVGSPEIDSQEAFNSQFSVPGFRVPSLESIVGNMGEDLDHGGLAEEVEDQVENNSGSIQAEEGEVPEAIIEARPSSIDPTPATSRLIHIA
ncbi:hypothetical protein EW026_g7976 [Hermanssonia centrifuga]|uniref:Uncharacterized protein n=1 Tax=Hermanssonia centrifuga TaxID=98765 RepID=A0A4S4K601_9APHY|nr:hypothetical protein EW026_g7976 [Hermanssonia centrifuga]